MLPLLGRLLLPLLGRLLPLLLGRLLLVLLGCLLPLLLGRLLLVLLRWPGLLMVVLLWMIFIFRGPVLRGAC